MTAESRVRSMRDLLVFESDRKLVLACDSVGGIGARPGDTIAAGEKDTAYFAARVPLLEVLCAGAQPLMLVDTLCQDIDSAATVIEEFRAIAAEAGINAEGVTGSTEDNVETSVTGIGVVVIGEIMEELLSGGANSGDLIVCVGWPRSAPADRLYKEHPDVVPISAIRTLLRSGLLTDALPVGSKGLEWEVEQLSQSAGLSAIWIDNQPIPVRKSGGPSSCVLLSFAPENEKELHLMIDSSIPWTRVATLEAR
ncbi:AIR synthase related protein [Trueperella pyogenes]|uniref:AIR synthase related protein n=1 Tax=Trueperella pyogenes TaxID=1661 RepID=UPI003132B367